MVANFGANTALDPAQQRLGRIHAPRARPLATGNNPYAVTVGDLDGDGDLDIAVTNSGGAPSSVFLNNGSAAFTPATGSPFAVGVSPGGVVMGDFDEDGDLDLSTANFGSNTASILINASEHLVGTAGNDPLTGDIGNDLIEGLGGDDSLVGGNGHDRMFGGAGNDVLDGGNGIDAMAGGVGNDTYFVDNQSDVVTETPVQAPIRSSRRSTTSSDQTWRIRCSTGNADLQGYGNDLVNTITGNSGNNILDGGIGADAMIGGAGNDAYVVDNIGDVVTENANEGNDSVYASVDFRLASNLEYLILQSAAGLQGYGNGLANALYGTSGNNLLDGDAGADSMYGGAGNDSYIVDNTGDQAIENANEGTDTVFASVSFMLGADVENLNLTGAGNTSGTGNGLANTIAGNSGNNTLDGGAGADSMYGGLGNDAYIVDNIGDMVIENANEGNDTVYATVNYRLSANLEYLVLQGSAGLQGSGNALANALYGNTGNNTLDGDAGADTMLAAPATTPMSSTTPATW